MTQQVIDICPVCKEWRHYTAFRPGIPYCLHCYTIKPRITEGAVDPTDGTMKDSEFEAYMLEPIIRARSGKSRERVETALPLRIDLGRFPTRKPVKRKKR